MGNPYEINPLLRNYLAKADIGNAIYKISKQAPIVGTASGDQYLNYFSIDLKLPFSQIPDTTITDDMEFTVGICITSDAVLLPKEYNNIRINASLNAYYSTFKFLNNRIIKYTPVVADTSYSPYLFFCYSYRNSPGRRIRDKIINSKSSKAVIVEPFSISASLKKYASEYYYDIISDSPLQNPIFGIDEYYDYLLAIEDYDTELHDHLEYLLKGGVKGGIQPTRFESNIYNITLEELYNDFLYKFGNELYIENLLYYDLIANLHGAYYTIRNPQSLSFEFEYGPDIEKLTPDYDNTQL